MDAAAAEARAVPVFTEDLFAEAVLKNPFPIYRKLRDLGPVVRLQRPDVYALARFEHVRDALRAPQALISGKGVGFNSIINTPPGEARLIDSDGERHDRLRMLTMQPLGPRELSRRRAELREIISARVAQLVGAGWFEGVTALAQHLPLTAISHLVGLPEEGRNNMLRWASASFNLVGPQPEQFPEDIEVLRELGQYLMGVDSDKLAPNGWVKTLFDKVDSGVLTPGEARATMSAFVTPSLDTTIYAQGNLLYNLGASPEQWRLLKARPELIPSAVLESVRHSAVVRWFARVAAKDYEVEGEVIPAGARVMLIFGSANRDERRFPNPDAFDVTRNPTDQLGWGNGPHTCAGMHLAKLEMEVLLEALLDQVETIEVGEPAVGCNQGLYGFDSVPLRLS